MTKTLSTLKKFASGRTVSILFILTMAIYFLMLLYSIPMVKSFAPNTALFDLSPSGYSYQHAMSLLEELGNEGRQIYLSRQLPLDFIYPGLFAISYTLLLIWLFSKSVKDTSNIFYLAFIPALGGLFDYLENIYIIRMINSFPYISPGLVQVASFFTLLKSIFATVFFLLLFAGFAAFVFTKTKTKPVSVNN
jgi:hypothetical protein